MKRTLICIIFSILCWNYVCAGEQNQFSNSSQTGLAANTANQFQGITITETEKMETEKFSKTWLKTFVIFKEKKYKIDEAVFLFSLANEKTLEYYNKSKEYLKKSNYHWSNNYELWLKFEDYFLKAVESFNSFLAASQQNRKKVQDAINKVLLEKLIKEQAEREQEEREAELEKKANFWFIGIKADVGFAIIPGDSIQFAGGSKFVFGGGMRVAGFFPVYESLKIGFIIDLVYKTLWFESIHSTQDHLQYLGSNIMFGLRVKGFYFGLGMYLQFRISSSTNGYPGTRFDILLPYSEVGLVDTGPVMVIGWMPEFKKSKFFIGIETRYGLIKNYKVYDKKYSFISFYFEFGIGF